MVAKSRRLKATWTMESADPSWHYPKIKIGDISTYPGIAEKIYDNNIHSIHGQDVEEEIATALAKEITKEIDNGILESLRKAADDK